MLVYDILSSNSKHLVCNCLEVENWDIVFIPSPDKKLRDDVQTEVEFGGKALDSP